MLDAVRQANELAAQLAGNTPEIAAKTANDVVAGRVADPVSESPAPIDATDIGFVNDQTELASIDETPIGTGALEPEPPTMAFEETDPELTSFADDQAVTADDSGESWFEGE